MKDGKVRTNPGVGNPDILHPIGDVDERVNVLRFDREEVLEALAIGMPVYLYSPGLPQAPKNRALAASIATAQRELKNWGVLFTDGSRRHLVTAEEAKALRKRGQKAAPGAVLTPLAKEILEG